MGVGWGVYGSGYVGAMLTAGVMSVSQRWPARLRCVDELFVTVLGGPGHVVCPRLVRGTIIAGFSLSLTQLSESAFRWVSQ